MLVGMRSALSGLQAFSCKAEATAHNVANMQTEGFKRTRVTLAAQVPSGVQATIGRDDTPGPFTAEATSKGMELIEQSNVDLSVEIPEMLRTVHGYKANVNSLRAGDEMMRTVLDIKA